MQALQFKTLGLLFLGALCACATEQDLPSQQNADSLTAAEEIGSDCPEKDASWTFLFYMVADDGSQSFDTSTARYLNTMPSLPENVEAFVLLDRCASPYWPISTTTGRLLDSCAQLYKIQPDGRPELIDTTPYKLSWLDDSQGDVNMGTANTLASFVQFGMEQTETTNYGLILAGHGNGDQVGFDATNDASLNHPELGFALEKALTNVNQSCHQKLDVVVLAACAMATAGIYSSLTPHAQWLIASQENIYGYDLSWMHGLGVGNPDAKISLAEVSQALSNSRVTGDTGTGQQVTLALSQEMSTTLDLLVAEVGALLMEDDISRSDLEDASFNPRTYDFRLIAEKVQDGAVLGKVDSLLGQAVFDQTELSQGMRDSLQAYGISVTTSDLGLPGSLLF